MKKNTQTVLLLLMFCCLPFRAEAQPAKREIPQASKNLSNPYAGDVAASNYGSKLYRKYCWICHGTTGAGDGPGSATLNVKPASFNETIVLNRTDGELYWWINNGGDNMQPFKDLLSDEQVWKTVTYIRSLQNK